MRCYYLFWSVDMNYFPNLFWCHTNTHIPFATPTKIVRMKWEERESERKKKLNKTCMYFVFKFYLRFYIIRINIENLVQPSAHHPCSWHNSAASDECTYGVRINKFLGRLFKHLFASTRFSAHAVTSTRRSSLPAQVVGFCGRMAEGRKGGVKKL